MLVYTYGRRRGLDPVVLYLPSQTGPEGTILLRPEVSIHPDHTPNHTGSGRLIGTRSATGRDPESQEEGYSTLTSSDYSLSRMSSVDTSWGTSPSRGRTTRTRIKQRRTLEGLPRDEEYFRR